MIRDLLRESIRSALRACELGEELPFVVEQPPLGTQGDFSTNAALMAASKQRLKPREVAERLVKALAIPGAPVDRIDIAGPGFINFHLKPAWLHEVVREIRALGTRYGNSSLGGGRRVQVEFVSANPNGPIHIGHGRGGAIGDVFANLLAAAGYEVDREFYINDAVMSGQMRKFAESLEARYREAFGETVTIPEDGYKGQYVKRMALDLRDSEGDRFLHMPFEDRIADLTRLGRERMLAWQKKTLEQFGISFDRWFSEQTLHESGAVEQVVDRLREAGVTYEADDAVWLRASQYGDDKDRVLVRRNGASTYLTADLAYHYDKYLRGYDRLVDLWGPDHHGYVLRTRAGVSALGCAVDNLEIYIYQIVRLFQGGKEVKVSKRTGDIIALDDLIEEVGADATRFYFLMRSHDSHLDFDLDLAVRQSNENPVYYVQYAHARICSILEEARQRGVPVPEEATIALDSLVHPQETALIRKLADLPHETERAVTNFEPHRLTRYAQDVAGAFHSFYTECRVLGPDSEQTLARLALAQAARIVLQKSLSLLGISAPERM